MITSFDPIPQPALPATQPPLARLRLCWHKMVRNGLTTLALCLLISLGLWLGSDQRPLMVQVVYSTSIGMASWLCIDGGRFFVDISSPTGFPRGWRGGALIGVGVLMGFLFGTNVGDLYAGRSTWAMLDQQPRAFAVLLLFTVAIGVGISSYFYATGKSAYLRGQLEVSRRHAAEAQLKLLQSQLDPHMLFNTLANLRVLIATDAPRAQAMLDQLISYLRATLSGSRQTSHPLAAEFDRLRDYLDLMAVRMGPRLGYTLELPAELAGLPVPTLLLQPLVENAVLHGLEPSVAGGQITVRARQQNQQLWLEVDDTGVGLTVPTLQRARPGQPSTGFGMAQVRERLHTAYGSQATIELIATQEGNTKASVSFPIKNSTP